MIDTSMPLADRLASYSDPILMNNLHNLLLRHEQELTIVEKETLRDSLKLFAAVQEAMKNRQGRRRRPLWRTDGGKLTFEAVKAGNNIRLTGNFGDETTTGTAAGQEVRLRYVNHQVEVSIEDPTPI